MRCDISIIFVLGSFAVLSLITNIGCLVNSDGKINFELHTKYSECRTFSELIVNDTCLSVRINRTTEYGGFDIFIKPSVQLDHLYVS